MLYTFPKLEENIGIYNLANNREILLPIVGLRNAKKLSINVKTYNSVNLTVCIMENKKYI